jgi:signal peptidase
MTTPKRTAASIAGNIVLTIAAVGGVICIVAVIAAVGFNITLIMFRTGSMAPTIPAGSLAVVHQIPSSTAKVGDIVTIDRPGLLPITHRITSIAPAAGDGARSITMRGDANASDDASPYVVSHVRIVLVSAPGLAYAIVALGNPFVLGSITIAAGALVTWAFWPRAGRVDTAPRMRPRRLEPRR